METTPEAQDFVTLLAGFVIAALVGGIKYLAPLVKEKTPNFAWPLVALLLGWLGTKLCGALSATCSGNPLGWGSEEAAAAGMALTAVIMREAVRVLRPWYAKLLSKATVGALVVGLALATATPARADYDWQPYDCESVGSYVGNKVPGLVAFFQFAGGVGEAVADSGLDLTQPLDFSGDAGFRYLGLGMSVANAYGQAGLSPLNLFNWFASFACRRLVFVDGG